MMSQTVPSLGLSCSDRASRGIFLSYLSLQEVHPCGRLHRTPQVSEHLKIVTHFQFVILIPPPMPRLTEGPKLPESLRINVLGDKILHSLHAYVDMFTVCA